MKNKNDNKFKRRRFNNVSRKIVLQYCVVVALYIAVLISLVYFAINMGHRLVAYIDRSFYDFLMFFRDHIWLITGIVGLVGWVFITYYFISKPLKYLNEVIDASEKLVTPTAEPIVISKDLVNTEIELNRVRENALNDARAAKDAEQRKNDLIVYLAHDLKTPLTSVIGYLTLLHDEKEISEESREKYINISLNKAERLEDLINEFFEITRFNLSNIELQYSTVNLTRMLEQLTFEANPVLAAKGLQCSLSAAADIMIKCDVNKMQRVFDNLLRNAMFYSYENSVIEITATQDDKETVIRFMNRCDTIPPERLERIFEQFFRLDSSRSSDSGGAGLGLAIAKEIVRHHNGTITAKSENDTVEFTVTIPNSSNSLENR